MCSLGLSANQSAVFLLNQHQSPATSQSTVLFSHNKSAPAINYSQANTVTASRSEAELNVAVGVVVSTGDN